MHQFENYIFFYVHYFDWSVKKGVEAVKKIFEPHRAPTVLVDSNLERLLLNHILKEISDHTGFLIEDRLRELLAPHTRNDNIIIRLDNVFQVNDTIIY